MLSPTSTPPFTPLAHEQTLYTSPPRIGLSIATPAHFPGKQQQPFSLPHSSGIVYLTNRRIIYLPDKPTDRLQSFAAPLLHLHDSHVTAPFFGPNVWTALLQPVAGGGIPTPSTGVVELKLTFKEGGAFDFHTRYERVRERFQHAAEVARMDGGANGNGGNHHTGDATANVTLEDLPAYQEHSDGPLLAPTGARTAFSESSAREGAGHSVATHRRPDEMRSGRTTATASSFAPPPDEPPPGYEEAQMAGLRAEAERRLHEDREQE